jgi:adenine phosphoribosyltransferase
MPDATTLAAAIRDVPDFPKPGILFKDISPILSDPALFSLSIDLLTATAGDTKIDKVVGIDARGFIFAAAVADRLKAGFVPIRKKGKLPWITREEAYSLEYGEAVVEIHQDAVHPGEKILLVDDLLATGGTMNACCDLVTRSGATIVGITVLIELTFLNGRARLAPFGQVHSVITY